MTDHSPLQQALAIRLAAADVAAKRLAELQARRREIETRSLDLARAAEEARAALRDAAGANAAGEGDSKTVERARKAVVAADSDAELAGLELEGITSRITQAEREHASKKRDAGLVGVDVCRVAVAVIEEQARSTFARFADLMRERHRIAKRAALLATEASGHTSEPIEWSNPTSGLLRRDAFDEGFAGVLREAGLSDAFAPYPGLPAITTADLLELELPREAQAAE